MRPPWNPVSTGTALPSRWTIRGRQANNIVVELDAAAYRRPSKAKSAERIDGLGAAIRAVGLANSRWKPTQRSMS